MRRILSVCLVATLVLTGVIPAFGASAAKEKGMEAAITAVKSIITIPAEYTEFEYQKTEANEGKAVTWNFQWQDKDNSKGHISAAINQDGELISYYRNDYDANNAESVLGAITAQEAMKNAQAFLGKAKGEKASSFRLQDKSDVRNQGDAFSFLYQEYKNEVPVKNSIVTIGVDKGDAAVKNYSAVLLASAEYPENKDTITAEKAKESYIANIGIGLEYQYYYDYKTKEGKVFPVYVKTGQAKKAIDAKTGEAVSLYDERYMAYGGGALKEANAMDRSGANESLTAEELSAVNEIAKLISKEEAEAAARVLVPGLTAQMKISSANLYKQYDAKDQFIWNLYLQDSADAKVRVSLDAKTGEVLNFYGSTDGIAKTTLISEETAKKQAEALIQKLAGDKWSQVKYRENGNEMIAPLNKDGAAVKPALYSFQYVRQVNGIDFGDNYINVTYDNAQGKITNYQCNWLPEAVFPSVEKAMSKEAAFDQFVKMEKYQLMYAQISKGQGALVYEFADNASTMLDPFTGMALNYQGNPAAVKQIPSYTDLTGHWCEAAVNTLLDNGIYIRSGVTQFEPNKEITQGDFLRFLYSGKGDWIDSDEELYDSLIRQKIINKEEKNPTALVSKQDATKYIVRYLGYDKIAKQSKIFVYPFKDGVTEEYKGYIAIGQGLDIVKGDSKGKFNGSKIITNAEAASLIYQTMK